MTSKIIIGCGAKKRDIPAPAWLLYQGNLFMAALGYARTLREDSDILILSAKHGLVTLDTVLEPYEQRMGCAGTASYELLGQQVKTYCGTTPPEMILASRVYWGAFMSGWQEAYGRDAAIAIKSQIATPLEGMGIGQRTKWLNDNRLTNIFRQQNEKFGKKRTALETGISRTHHDQLD